MRRNNFDLSVTIAAEKIISERNITALPVDPFILARSLGIEIVAKSTKSQGVSGMLLRQANDFVIVYATHIYNIGFQNFSVAHELGHYFLPGHIDAVLSNNNIHKSHAGFVSEDRYELEADHFAAALLMPHSLFNKALRRAGEGLPAVEKLASQCRTSLIATAIRYTQCTRDAVAIVISTGNKINYCFMSKALQELKNLQWIRKGEPLSPRTATFDFNQDLQRVRDASRADDNNADIREWFNGDQYFSINEQVIGLGKYGKTLTVLTALDIEEQIESIEEDEELVESWNPNF